MATRRKATPKRRAPTKRTPARRTPVKRRAPAKRVTKRRRPPRPPAPPPPAAPRTPHVDAVNAYIADVLSGAVPACRWVKLAAKRHQRDLAHVKKGWRYTLDTAKAERACRLIENLPHIKGERAKSHELIRLEPWQCFIVVSLFGWVDRATGVRRFRIAYIEVPRKNGKSTLLSAIAIVATFLDGEAGAHGYSAATTRDQARIVFQDAQEMVRREPELRARFGIELTAHGVIQPKTGSKLEALSADAHTLDGLNPHFAAIDELHAHPTRKVYDVIETAMGARHQPLLITITTAGDNRSGICYEVRDYATKVLQQVAAAESFFGIIYTIDEDDDWTEESSWIKANPNWGVSIKPENIADLARKAMQLPAAQANFKTKHLDVWISSNSALYDVEAWRRCADPDLTRESIDHLPCITAVDLASTSDLCARVDLYRDDSEDQPRYFAISRSYVPEATIAESRNAQYTGWQELGRLIATDGDSTDYQRIEDDLKEIVPTNRREVVFDKYQSRHLAGRLQDEGVDVTELSMNVATLSEPTKMLDVLMRQGRIRHDGDPVLEWAISNVVGHYDAKDNVYPRKERPENKIDPAVALLMALSRWLSGETTDEVYEGRGIVVI